MNIEMKKPATGDGGFFEVVRLGSLNSSEITKTSSPLQRQICRYMVNANDLVVGWTWGVRP